MYFEMLLSLRRYSFNCNSCRNILCHHCSRSYDGLIADCYTWQDLCPHANKNLVSNRASSCNRNTDTDFTKRTDFRILMNTLFGIDKGTIAKNNVWSDKHMMHKIKSFSKLYSEITHLDGS